MDKMREVLFPTATQLAVRGEPGTAGSNTVGVFKQIANTMIQSGAMASNPIGTMINGAPQIPINNNELEGAAGAELGIAIAGVVVGGGGAGAARNAGGQGARALGDLTRAEIKAIQGVVNEAGRPLEVVGSAARGTRNAASDIDYVAPPSSLKYFEGLEGKLPSIDPSHGIVPGVGNPNIGPVIRFEPKVK